MATMLPSQANVIVRELTQGQMHVEANFRAVYLVHEATGERVHLLPYQLTPEGIDDAVAEFWEPQAI